jgi:hypothetical protein
MRGAGSSPLGGKVLIPLLTFTLKQYHQHTTPCRPRPWLLDTKKTTYRKLVVMYIYCDS